MDNETVEAPVRNYAYNESADDIIQPEPIVAEVTPEPKIEPEAQAPAAEIKPEPKAEPAEAKPAEVKPEIPVKPAEVTATDWKKAIKDSNPDKYEVLKEMGYTDWTIDMIKYADKTGSWDDYINAKSADYSKMTPEQLIKLDMKRQYPGMNERALNFKYNKDLEQKYYLNREDYPEDSDEAVYGQEQLRIDGEQKRKQFIEEQQQFKAPEPQPDLDATNREADLQRQRASLGESIMNNAFTKSLQANKYLTFGEGEESFNYPVEDVQSLVDTALNAIVNSGYTDISKLDVEVFYKQLLLGKDMKAYEKAFADHIRNVSKKKLQDELQNVTQVNNNQPDAPIAQKDYGYRG